MYRPERHILFSLLFLGGLFTFVGPVAGQIDYGSRLGEQKKSTVNYAPQGPSVLMGAVDPAVRRWFIPQELFDEHRWRQWEYTNYARQPFRRYVDPSIEGDYFYDLYGNRVTQGWLIFNSSQTSNQGFGNVLFKANRFNQWFSELVIAGDHKGQYHYALTIGSNLRSTLTPMSFSKPRMDGVQFDVATDKYEGTMVFSRFTGPRGTQGVEIPQTNNTTLFGGRLTAQIGDFVELGAHTVNSHQANTLSTDLVENQLRGGLTTAQNQTISSVQVVLRDDSPADGTGGAAYFPAGSDIVITYRDGRTDRGSDLRFEPVVEGGVVEQGFIAANGNVQISLTYDFNDPVFVNQAKGDQTDIVGVEFQLVLANDYQIWMSSDRQTNSSGEPVLLLIERAEGNIQDITNLRTVSFDYGLPTSTSILGGTLKISEVWGLDLYAEYDLSWSYRKYPNVQEESHKATSGIGGKRKAPAWMINLSKEAYPFFLLGEAYSMDPFYNTQSFVTNASGVIDYSAGAASGTGVPISANTSAQTSLVELVEDNDDQDRIPDTFRADWSTPDLQVFPGWDQNNDFQPDLNQNDNRVKINNVPDYEEPFLRFAVDRPEFLYGMDMNNNFWVDQYENDEEPDYPYRKDHKGYNVYGGVHLSSKLRLMAGALREELISSEQQNNSTYVVATYDDFSPRYGNLRLFQMGKIVEDDIPNPLLQWAPNNTLRGGSLTRLEDPLLARDTFVNQSFIGHSLKTNTWHVTNKVNYVLFRQLMDKGKRRNFNLGENDFFLGIINKASYRYDLGRLWLEPRWKSEYLRQSRDLFTQEGRTSLTELFSLILHLPLLKVTTMQAGTEYVLFNDMDEDANDFSSLLGAVQFSNTSAYQGYQIKALVGMSVERKDFKQVEASTGTQAFITIFAGLE
ncbi:MAG: hypothetical protein GKR89_18795 [Candidatus Latescibacteria bacterium]|nr:hypothetical protein [Candidatus Latescibacterota bacterium]